MNREEFDASLNKQDKELAEAIARLTNFVVDTESTLIDFALNYYSDLAIDKGRLAATLKKEVHEEIVGISDTIDHYLHYPNVIDDSKEDPENFKVPDLNDVDESEEILQNIIKDKNPTLDADFINEIKEDIKQNREEKEFLFSCHRKILELIYLHFPEVIDFSPNGIRKINFYSYCSAALYTQAFYFLISEPE